MVRWIRNMRGPVYDNLSSFIFRGKIISFRRLIKIYGLTNICSQTYSLGKVHLYTLYKNVQKNNIFLTSLYEDVFYCIAVYFPLFCWQQLFTQFETKNFTYQCKNSIPCLIILFLTTTLEPHILTVCTLGHIRRWTLALFYQENSQMATLPLHRKPFIYIKRN